MQTVTINVTVPDETAARLADATAERLARINRITSALLPELLADEPEEEAEDFPADLYERYPLPASLTEPLSETARKVQAAIDAGDTVDGETFFAEMRRLSGRA